MSLTELLIELAELGGKILRESQLDLNKIAIVAVSRDDVTRRIDLEVEKAILDKLREHKVNCIFIGEEHGVVFLGEKPEHIVVVDPLDGSANYVSNIPIYAVSIAACRYKGEDTKLGDVIAGVINYVPLGVMYVADVERQRFIIQGRDMQFEKYPHEKPSFVLYIEPRDMQVMLKFLEEFWREFPDLRVRVLGAASIELTETLLNKFLAFIDLRSRLRVVDIAAAYAIARVLGAKMTDHRGVDLGEYKLLELPRLNVVASRSEDVHDKLLNILSRVLRKF